MNKDVLVLDSNNGLPENFVSDLITSATAPINPHFEYYKNDPYRPLYVNEAKPKAVLRERIVLSDTYPVAEKGVCVPEKIAEFDFYNEYEGYVKANKLNVHQVDYTKIGSYDYYVDLEEMILYRYVWYELA